MFGPTDMFDSIMEAINSGQANIASELLQDAGKMLSNSQRQKIRDRLRLLPAPN